MKSPKPNASVSKKLAKLTYKKDAGEIQKGLVGTGFLLDIGSTGCCTTPRPRKPWCLTEERICKIGWEFWVMYKMITTS